MTPTDTLRLIRDRLEYVMHSKRSTQAWANELPTIHRLVVDALEEPVTEQLFASPVQPTDTDERYTPPWLFEELGWFDLDPCSPEGGPLHAHARKWFTAADDGLSQPWDGLVFLNPPFSNPTPWADRFAGHANGVAILPYSNSAWRVRMFRTVDMLFAPADLRFVGQTHEQQRVSMPVFFAAYGDGTERLVRLVRSGRLEGTALERAF